MHNVVLKEPGQVRVIDSEIPVAGPGEALVQLRTAGICGSDLAAYRGTSPHVRYPLVLGHELLVDVLDCPSRPDLVGQRAVVEPLLPCSVCRACRQGRYNCCVDLRVLGVHTDGGLRDFAPIGASHLFAVPPEMSDDLAALAEPTSIAYQAVRRSGIEAGQVAVIFGAGAIGLLIAQILVRGRGCRAYVVDLDPARLEVAEALGARPLHGSRDALVQAISAATGGELADVVFEATGSAVCTRMTTDLVGHGGRIVLIGWNKGPVEVDTVTLMRKEVDLFGSRNSANAFPAVLRLLADGVIDASRMVTHHYELGETTAALELLDRGEAQAVKILVHRA